MRKRDRSAHQARRANDKAPTASGKWLDHDKELFKFQDDGAVDQFDGAGRLAGPKLRASGPTGMAMVGTRPMDVGRGCASAAEYASVQPQQEAIILPTTSSLWFDGIQAISGCCHRRPCLLGRPFWV